MEATTDGFTIQIANDVAEIAKVTALLQAFGRVHALPEALVGHFVLALDELVANIVQHGLQPGTPATIRISVSLAPSTLSMEISDPGRAFDPLCETPPPDLVSPLEQRRVGGLGVHFVRKLMDEVRYRREHDRNVLTLSKARPTTSAQNPR